MQYKALPWLRVCTFGLGAQSANIRRRDWNVRNAIIEVLVLCNPRTLSDPPLVQNSLVPRPLPAAILKWAERWSGSYRKLYFATNEVVSVTCTHTRDTLELLRHLFGGISLVKVINRLSVGIAKIPQSPVQEIVQPLQQMKWFQSRAPTQRDTLALVCHLFGGISLVNVINRFFVALQRFHNLLYVQIPWRNPRIRGHQSDCRYVVTCASTV